MKLARGGYLAEAPVWRVTYRICPGPKLREDLRGLADASSGVDGR